MQGGSLLHLRLSLDVCSSLYLRRHPRYPDHVAEDGGETGELRRVLVLFFRSSWPPQAESLPCLRLALVEDSLDKYLR